MHKQGLFADSSDLSGPPDSKLQPWGKLQDLFSASRLRTVVVADQMPFCTVCQSLWHWRDNSELRMGWAASELACSSVHHTDPTGKILFTLAPCGSKWVQVALRPKVLLHSAKSTITNNLKQFVSPKYSELVKFNPHSLDGVAQVNTIKETGTKCTK